MTIMNTSETFPKSDEMQASAKFNEADKLNNAVNNISESNYIVANGHQEPEYPQHNQELEKEKIEETKPQNTTFTTTNNGKDSFFNMSQKKIDDARQWHEQWKKLHIEAES